MLFDVALLIAFEFWGILKDEKILKSFFGGNSAEYVAIYFKYTDHTVPIPGRECLLCLALQIFL